MFKECLPEHNCIVHDADIPFPEYAKDIDYHLIILGPTFLCDRHLPQRLEHTKSVYDFIRASDACKVALPQDDYDSSAILDSWLFDWQVDYIYPVCPENWDLLYPKSSQKASLRLGYTGYIDETWVEQWKSVRPSTERSIDISYRTHSSSANRCHLRNLKYAIADRFKAESDKLDHQLVIDISNRTSDTIPGARWHEFLMNSKFCIVTPSGSSLLDPYGDYRRCVEKYPLASYSEASENCYAGVDKQVVFTAISPRNIESGLAETIQLATPGSYSGLMEPYVDFIPLEEDCGNLREVFQYMSDDKLVAKIGSSFKEKILSENRLLRSTIVAEIAELAWDKANLASRSLSVSRNDLVLSKRHAAESGLASYFFWNKVRIKKMLNSYPVISKVKRFLR
ncbi:hypothetical protein [Marinobacterium sp. xm-d-530]|uniref:hypothetical protein n=1 Tax=Marinobacterium sp. xm-d-530 TaxID=2497747 RepID=UPI001569AA66|nr:hypothetical protein [Marinobacterium sp. xm-d-530]